MNIIFYTRFFPDPNSGGIERVTAVLAKKLILEMNYSVHCMVPLSQKCNSKHHDFSGLLYLDEAVDANVQSLIGYIRDNKIRIIISQYAIDKYNALFALIKKETGVQLVTVYHFSPGCEFYSLRMSLRLSFNDSIKDIVKRLVKVVLTPFYIGYYERKISLSIQQSFRNSDSFVLLSNRFKSDFFNIYGIDNGAAKIVSIANPLSYDFSFLANDLHKKENIVLIVARHSESQKRLSLALKIWAEVEKKGIVDWRLILVGDGEDNRKYRQYAKRLNLKQIDFVGKADPKSYYCRASIFVMTSSFEGFGVTLTESQQMGVVPMAFDSYASLHDIIISGYNGMIVENNNIELYVEELVCLMRDSVRRRGMALNAIESSRRFSSKVIVNQWINLFDTVNKSI